MEYTELTENQKNAVCKELDCEPDDLERWMDSGDYLVLTDEEADEKAKEEIKNSLWAFTPSFLAGETGLPEEMFKALADNNKCESNNDTILQVIEGGDGLNFFVESAISADGRGHFLSTYDGDELEIPYQNDEGKTEFVYVYRIN